MFENMAADPLARLTEPLTRGSQAWRNALIDMAEWAGAQNARMELGLPSEWNQAAWVSEAEGVGVAGHCGTAACLAGYHVLSRGWKPYRYDDGDLSNMSVSHPLVEAAEPDQEAYRDVEDLATRLLDLTLEEADRLFHGDNNLEAVLDAIRDLLDDDQ